MKFLEALSVTIVVAATAGAGVVLARAVELAYSAAIADALMGAW